MITPLQKISLYDLLDEPVLFDANIFMTGVERSGISSDYSFENRKELYLIPVLEKFNNILIHEEVYCELDEKVKELINNYIGAHVTIVNEGNLYGTDPYYTDIFNEISSHELVNYDRGKSKDRGEVYSMAYAAYYDIHYFCSREIMVDYVVNETDALKNVDVVTFDVIILLAYCFCVERNDRTKIKGLKSIYKRYCADVIKRHNLPGTLNEYIAASQGLLR